MEYPFFVFGQGWSSCCPDRTTELFELSCAKLCVGDVCVSLTLRSLRNGSVVESQKSAQLSGQCHIVDATVRNSTSPNGTLTNRGLLMKASREPRQEPPPALGRFPGQGEGVCGPPMADSRTREIRQESAKMGDTERPLGRKRRWSAPERDQTEREEPPLALPRPSFIPQEVKISIEGHSNAGSEMCLNKM